MARLSRQQKLDRYKHRIDHARRWRESEGYDELWRRMRDLYAGKHFPVSSTSEDRIAINIAFSTVNVIFPSISVNHPKITVEAKKEQDSDRAMIAEAVINHFWRVHNFREPFRRATKDYLTFGHGWLKVGYRFREEETPYTPEQAEEEFQRALAEVDMFAEVEPELVDDLPSPEDLEANKVGTTLSVVEDRPFMERVSPFDIFVDPEATCMADASWIAQRIVRPLEDVQEDQSYRPGARRKVQPDTSISKDGLSARQRRRIGADSDRVTVWEFYDLKNRTLCVFAEASDEYLVDPTDMPFPFDSPFVMLRNYDVPDEFYPVGDLEMLEGPQLELDKTRSQMMNHRRKYSRKWLYRESAFNEQGRQALLDERDGIMVPVEEDVPLQETVVPLPITSMSADLYGYSQQIEQDIDKISGVHEYARGSTPSIRRTATEAAMIQDAANSRAADKLAVIEVAIGECARKVMQLLQAFLTTPQTTRIVGPEGKSFWFDFDYQDIEGEFEFEVEGGSTQPRNESFRQQKALDLMAALAPMVGVVVDPAALVKHVLQDGFDVKNPDEFLLQQPMGGMPPQGGMPAPPPQGVGAGGGDGFGDGGIPPEILNQLESQSGLQPQTF